MKEQSSIKINESSEALNSPFTCPTHKRKLLIAVSVELVSPIKAKVRPTRTFECPICGYNEGPYSKKVYNRKLMSYAKI